MKIKREFVSFTCYSQMLAAKAGGVRGEDRQWRRETVEDLDPRDVDPAPLASGVDRLAATKRRLFHNFPFNDGIIIVGLSSKWKNKNGGHA